MIDFISLATIIILIFSGQPICIRRYHPLLNLYVNLWWPLEHSRTCMRYLVGTALRPEIITSMLAKYTKGPYKRSRSILIHAFAIVVGGQPTGATAIDIRSADNCHTDRPEIGQRFAIRHQIPGQSASASKVMAVCHIGCSIAQMAAVFDWIRSNHHDGL